MKKLSRFLALGMGAVLMAQSLIGCGGSGDEKLAVNKDAGRVYYLNFKPEAADQWKALAKKYQDETGVEVNVQTAASGTYEQQLKSEMAKNDAPTIFQVNGPVGLSTWDDYCMDLADTDILKNLNSEEYALKNNDGTIKGVAYAIETYGIIYNRALLNKYIENGGVIESEDDIRSFKTLKAVADDIQSKKEELGIEGAFTSAGFDSSSDWRFKTHLANLPLYYEYKADGVNILPELKGTYLPDFKNIFDLYITDSTCEPTSLSGKTGDDSASEFALGEAVFYQNGTWAYNDIKDNDVADEDLGMLPIYIGADGEENQGLCTGSENYWCINSEVSEKDQKASLDFLKWAIESDEGRDAIANEMGIVTPFKTMDDYLPENPLVIAASKFNADKTPVTWNFTTMPSEEWKNVLGSAMLEYAQGTGEWDAVKSAFVDNWAVEYKAAHENEN